MKHIMNEQPNWELILHRLDTLTKKQDEFNSKLDIINEHLMKVSSIEKSVLEVNVWKTKLDEVVSISELKEIKEWKSNVDKIISTNQFERLVIEHEKLKTFKTQSTMIWVVVQAIILMVVFWKNLFN